jgi:hypothetical protein
VAAALLTLFAALSHRHTGQPGALLAARAPSSAAGAPETVRAVAGVDTRDLHGDPRLRQGPLAARWTGFWNVEESGAYRLLAETDGLLRLLVDGSVALAADAGRSRATVELAAGRHAVTVEYEGRAAPRRIRLQWTAPSGARGEFAAPWLFAAEPSAAELARGRRARALTRAAALVWLLPPLAVVLAGAARGRLSPRARAALRVALPAAVVLYAGALRFEALVARYVWHGPPWALRAERTLSELRPAALRWSPAPDEEFGGDPLTYLRRARAMRWFYEADVREPVFPAATRALLPLAGERTFSVNAASAVFSTLLVLATYLLGASAFGPGVGLPAAAALAVDRDAMWWGVEGFRDDAFALFTVLAAAALVRLRARPSLRWAVLAGVAGAGAVLTRVTALSFLLPAGAWLAMGRGEEARARRRAALVALLVALALAAPYLMTCALAYGDPLYAVNFHTRFYRSRIGLDHAAHMGWLEYLRSARGAGGLAGTGLTGLTTYPFANKWQGLDWVTPWLRRVLAPAAIAGLLLFLRTAPGRLLLLLLFCSLLPYAFTWNVPGGAEWRFTLVAYPFYLVAAAQALASAVWLLRRAFRAGGAWRASPRPAGPAPP